MTRGAGWPIAIAVVLAITVGANVLLLRIATEPNAYATEPDYYRKAVAWDSTAAAERASEATGWRCDADLVRRGRALELHLRLVDAAGAPVAGAAVHVTAIHNLAAATPSELTATPGDAGTYVATLPVAREGLWELRLAATRGGARFRADLRREAPGLP